MTASLVVLMPVYNDRPLIPLLLARLDAANSRSYAAVIPRRDDADYVAGETRLYP